MQISWLMDLKKYKWTSLCKWYVIFALFTHIFYISKTDKILQFFSQFSSKFLQHFWGNRFTCMLCSLSNNSGGSRGSTAGGGRNQMGAKRRRGRVREGDTPSRRWGSGGPPPGKFLRNGRKWCILSPFLPSSCRFFPKRLCVIFAFKAPISDIRDAGEFSP